MILAIIKSILSDKSMMYRILYIISIIFVCFACGGGNDNAESAGQERAKYKPFRSYAAFNDKPELHMAVALKKGITPMENRGDTVKCIDKMVHLPQELDIYKLDKLTHSLPFLVEDASKLLVRIGMNFRDSLNSKKLPAYKLRLTSITRTKEDVRSLGKRNINASENSVHCYGTTFDISWKRFDKIGPEGDDDVTTDRLKYILAEVLHDLRERGQCYVVHEKKQACFHITTR